MAMVAAVSERTRPRQAAQLRRLTCDAAMQRSSSTVKAHSFSTTSYQRHAASVPSPVWQVCTHEPYSMHTEARCGIRHCITTSRLQWGRPDVHRM